MNGMDSNGSIRTNNSNSTRRTDGLGNSHMSSDLGNSMIINQDDNVDSSNTDRTRGVSGANGNTSDEELALVPSTTSPAAEVASFSLFEMLWYTKDETGTKSGAQ